MRFARRRSEKRERRIRGATCASWRGSLARVISWREWRGRHRLVSEHLPDEVCTCLRYQRRGDPHAPRRRRASPKASGWERRGQSVSEFSAFGFFGERTTNRMRRFRIHSNAQPRTILSTMAACVESPPRMPRLRADHIDRYSCRLMNDTFIVRGVRARNDWLALVCIGNVKKQGDGSVVDVQIRRSRSLLVFPVIWSAAVAWNWIRGGGRIGLSIVILLTLIAVLFLVVATIAGLATSRSEDEADALEQLVRYGISSLRRD